MTDSEKWVVTMRRGAGPPTPRVKLPRMEPGAVLMDYAAAGVTGIENNLHDVAFQRVRFDEGFGIGRTTLFGLVRLSMAISNSRFESAQIGRFGAYKVEFIGCRFEQCHFGKRDVSSDFYHCSFRRCTFIRSTFVDVDFTSCQIEDSKFEDCGFVECRFGGVEPDRNSRLRGTARDVTFSGVAHHIHFNWKSADRVDFSGLEFREESYLDLLSGSDVKLPVHKNSFLTWTRDHPKIIESLSRLSSASRVRIMDILSGSAMSDWLSAIHVKMFKDLRTEDVAAVMQAARPYALTEYPFE